MSRLIASLLLALAFAPMPASAQNGSSQVRLMERFSLTSVSDLNFGRLTIDGTAGSVTIDANDSGRTTTGGVVPAGGSPMRGEFVGFGDAGRIVTINRQEFPLLTRAGGTETLTAQPLVADSSWRTINLGFRTITFKLIGLDGLVTLGLGATLDIPANTVPGVYTGDYTLTINYF